MVVMTDYSFDIIGLIAFTTVISSAVVYVLAQPSDLPVVKQVKAQGWSMFISRKCKQQQATADRIFMDFKYTYPGSAEQLRSLMTLNYLISTWCATLEKEIDSVESRNLINATL